MKTILTLLTFVVGMVTAVAQHSSLPVVPGSKGALPTEVQLPAAEAGRFGGFYLDYYHSWQNVLSSSIYREAKLSFPYAESLGGESYSLERKSEDAPTWEPITTLSAGHEEYNIVVAQPATVFRLILQGGPRNGQISNEVAIPSIPGALTRLRRWLSMNEHSYVGETLDAVANSMDVYNRDKQKWEAVVNPLEYLHYQWYRVNPHSSESTLIEGANERRYTVQPEDVGYLLLCAIRGDGHHVAFQLNLRSQPAKMPIGCSFEYIGDDGVVVNTDYVLEHPQRDLQLSEYFYEDGQSGYRPIPLVGNIETRQPGQYVFRTERLPESSFVRYLLQDSRGLVTRFNFYGDEIQVRDEVLVHHFKQYPLTLKMKLDEEAVATEVDLFRQDIDHRWHHYQTIAADNEGTAQVSTLITGRYRAKARLTDATMETYYPGVSLWSEAEDISVPGSSWDNIHDFSLLPTPPALTGSGIIEGRINLAAAGVQALDADSDPVVYRVYLKAVGGTVVAQTQTAADLTYRFEHVPFGNYEVLVNLDGLTLEQPHQVTLSEAQPVATNIDYTVSEGIISGIDTPTSLTERSADRFPHIYTIDGRSIRSERRNLRTLPSGVYIIGGKKVVLP